MPSKLSATTRYQNAALAYYLALTKSNYLHYGYWQPLPQSAEDLTLPRFRQAQEAYAHKLVNFIPQGVAQILDVGCGIGGNALKLLELGYQIDGLAPDPCQQQQFIETTGNRAGFYLSEFQTFTPPHSYDLILMSESSQYIDVEDLARVARSCLDRGGYLLLADMLRRDQNYIQGIFSNCHQVDQLQAALQQAGFRLVELEDISVGVAPTLDLCLENLHTFGISTFSYIADVISIAVPPIYSLLSWCYDTWAKKLVVEGLACRQIFDRHLCYQVQLWQLD